MSSSVTSSQTPAWPAAALPVPDSITIGREAVVAEVTRTLVEGDPRVVVLSGLGGVGKSRIAIEVSRRVAEAFGGRAAWVNLRNAPRVGGLQSSIATAFDVSVGEPEHFAETVAQSIGRKPALLVLDGAEALLHDLRMVDDLVKEAPALRVLVTSRVAVPARAAHARAAMESITVDVLDVPAETDDAETVAASPAVQLLVARAARAKADVEINDRTAPSIARLVAQLDGLPLAIELAAPLLKVLPPHLLVARIGDQLDPVVATIDWSHEQLSAEDRRLYRRLVVFGIPFRARHVRTFSERAISHGLSPLAPDVSDALERLAGAGLIRARADRPADDPATGPDDPRGLGVREYELPALIREDAKRRLDASGETTAAMWARANDLLALCELSHAELVARSRRDLLDQLDIVHGDLIAALDRARAAGEGRFLLRMTGALAEYWRSRGRLAEGRIWLDAALRTGPPERTAERARALHGSGMLANWQSDFGRARAVLLEALDIRLELGLKADAAATLNQLGLIGLDTGDLAEAEARCRQGLEIRRELGDEAAIAASLNTLGGVLHFGGRPQEARELFEESLEIRRRLGDEAGASVSLGNLGLVARDAEDLAGAETMLREAIETRERLGDRQRVSVVRHNLALVLWDRGDLDGARAELDAALRTSRELGDRLETSNALSDLGFVEAAVGNVDRAAALQGEALSVAARIGAKGIVAQSIDGAAGIVATQGDRAEAATLWAAADAIRREARYSMLIADRRRVVAERELARRAGDDLSWDAAWAEGDALGLEDAIARARTDLDAIVHAPRADGQVAV